MTHNAGIFQDWKLCCLWWFRWWPGYRFTKAFRWKQLLQSVSFLRQIFLWPWLSLYVLCIAIWNWTSRSPSLFAYFSLIYQFARFSLVSLEIPFALDALSSIYRSDIPLSGFSSCDVAKVEEVETNLHFCVKPNYCEQMGFNRVFFMCSFTYESTSGYDIPLGTVAQSAGTGCPSGSIKCKPNLRFLWNKRRERPKLLRNKVSH